MRSFAPSSQASADAEGEDLHSGALQLPANSVVLVTEAGIQEGKLVEKGSSSIIVLFLPSRAELMNRHNEHPHPSRSHLDADALLPLSL
jgi:hypothetical protein